MCFVYIKALSSKSLKALFSIRNALYSNKEYSVTIHTSVFDTLVKPILIYGSEIWGQDILHTKTNIKETFSNDKSEFERVHMRFCKKLLGVNIKSTNLAIRSELGRYPIICTIVKNVMKYFIRLEGMSNNRLVKQIYLKTKSRPFSTCDIANRFLSLLDIKLDDYDLYSRRDCDRLNSLFTSKFDMYVDDEWYSLLNAEHGPTGQWNKLTLYSKLKSVFKQEKYLTQITNPILRSNLTKLRISAHNLAIEKGRYRKMLDDTNSSIHYKSRTCNNCTLNKVENEYHFIMECKLYENQRKCFLDKLNDTLRSKAPQDLFIYLMKLSDNQILPDFATYVSTIMEQRKSNS